MNSPRIDPLALPFPWLGRLDAWWVRYGFVPVAVSAALALATAGAASFSSQFAILLLFVAVAASSVFGGFVPGLLATTLAWAGATLSPAAGGHLLRVPELRLLAAEGVLMAFLGGGLRELRRRARRSEAANRELERQILEIGDEERQRIGHDLHDGLGQHLTGISLLTESMAQHIAAGAAPRGEDMETVTRLVSEAIGWTRDLARNLSPVTLERHGLVAALEELAVNSGVLFGISCELNYDGGELGLDRKRDLHLYRIAQEAVSNSVKHGSAKNVRIALTDADHALRLVVEDDGSGLSAKTRMNPGLGLRIMDYRARMLGATLTAERVTAAGGTVVTCTCRTNHDSSEGP
jgi:signal transduction histidine kinase